MPETEMGSGTTVIEFSEKMYPNADPNLLYGQMWAYWANYLQLFDTVKLKMSGTTKLTVLGFVTMTVKMDKIFNCNCIKGSNSCTNPKPKPDANHFAGRRLSESRGNSNVYFFCEPEGTDVWNMTGPQPKDVTVSVLGVQIV